MRQPERHRVPVFRPNIAHVAIAELRPRDALDIGGQSFRQSIVPAADFRQRQVHHFVHEHPVRRQFIRRDLASHAHLDHESRFIGRAAAAHAAARRGSDAELDQRRRKMPVVVRDDVRRALDPTAQ